MYSARRAAARAPDDRLDDSSRKPASTVPLSYEDAAALCKARVDSIVAECRRSNTKYTDPDFNLELDFNSQAHHCLYSLKADAAWLSVRGKEGQAHYTYATSGDKLGTVPRSVKRVTDIFEDPQFFIDGATASDMCQGRLGDCGVIAALCCLAHKPGLIERLCVARDQEAGVYGFVFHRDGSWLAEIVDDQLYLKRPDFAEVHHFTGPNQERRLWENMSEELYRKTYQSNSPALVFARCRDPNETWLPLLEKAFAKAHGDYEALWGYSWDTAIEALTGGVASGLFLGRILDKVIITYTCMAPTNALREPL